MKTQLKILIALLFYLNIILTIDLFRRSAETAQAGQIQDINIAQVGGRQLGYGARIPVR